ncbi:MAG TPA: hypothetical protein VEZ47_13360, partial [Gemmatirosa sp.]|nr:hypothetical protein [Gemmatirosa sp.]
VCLRVLRAAADGGRLPARLARVAEVARGDLRRIGALRETAPGVYLVAQGPEDFERAVGVLLGTEPYQAFWVLIREGAPYESALTDSVGLGGLAKATRHDLGRRLANWGRHFGYLPGRSPRRTDRAQLDAFG